MARLPRISPLGIPQHVIQRGNNRQVCFAQRQDFAVYAGWLGEYAQEFDVDIHAWVFMTNHVHLLVTPRKEHGVSKMMQALGRRYVRYFNRAYQRTGTLWEGRYKACLVQSEHYLLHCQLYIELNPVRAKMVTDPADYIWSSYQAHALGKRISFHCPHETFLNMFKQSENSFEAYRDLFRAKVDQALLQDIRNSVNSGMALGSEKFITEMEQLYGRRLRKAKLGRPRKTAV